MNVAGIELPTHLSLPQVLRHHAQAHAARVALRQKEHGIWNPLTWADVHRLSLIHI